MTVFLKSTVRPCPSVRRPSSSTCSSTLKTSGCAFSTSSNSSTWIGPPPHRFGELAAFLVADIARRRADQAGDGVLLHELAHVDAHHGVARRRTGTRRAPWSARSCRRRWARGTGTSRSAGSGSCRPARARRTALATARTASALADDALCERVFHLAAACRARLPASVSTGMPVQRDTICGDVLGACTASLTIASCDASRRSSRERVSSVRDRRRTAARRRWRSRPRRWAMSISARALSSFSFDAAARPGPTAFSLSICAVRVADSCFEFGQFAFELLEAVLRGLVGSPSAAPRARS